jgi:hypothetical protein
VGLQVCGGFAEQGRVLTEVAESAVAEVAEHAANLAGAMTVIDVPLAAVLLVAAERTAVRLLDEHLLSHVGTVLTGVDPTPGRCNAAGVAHLLAFSTSYQKWIS